MSSDLSSLWGPAPFDPAFAAAVADGTDAAWARLSTTIGPGVVTFPLLAPAACQRWLDELDHRRGAGSDGAPPNSMHGYGTALADVGLAAALPELRGTWLAPLVRLHFGPLVERSIEGEHGFVTDYGPDADEELGFHVDNSVVTLNLCLGHEFAGSELYFRGVRCDLHRQTRSLPGEDFEIEHEVGTAVLHAGRHRHGVHPIRRGRRRNLIVWWQSAEAQEGAARCGPWCGWHALG